MRRFSTIAARCAALGILSFVFAFFIASSAVAQPDAPVLVSADDSDLMTVVVTFSITPGGTNLDTVTGQDEGNYQVYETATPANAVPVEFVVVSGVEATLALESALTDGVDYTVEVSNVRSQGGPPIVAGSTTVFTAGAGAVITPIADIHANIGSLEGQVVTVEGIVTIPSNYRGATISGYIQDASGRGINVFGAEADVAALHTIGNRVRVTGTVDLYFSTVEILDLTEVTLLETGLARPAAVQLSTGAASSANWEGTFIEINGTISSSVIGGPGRNYTVNDGSGAIVVRVVDTLGVSTFANGTQITARGTGGFFSPDFQVNVGLASDVFEDTGGSDTTPPTVVSASAAAENSVVVSFSETLDSATAQTAGNYQIYETVTPANTLSVSGASLSGTQVTLSLGANLVADVSYTVAVSNVEDGAGNVIAGGNTANFTYSVVAVTSIAAIHASIGSFEGQVVTVEGIVYIPTDYRGGTISGYIQDSSGRGINIFGTGADIPALQTVGNQVRLTGTVELYFSTVEIVDVTDVTVLASGVSRPAPVQLSTSAASNASWEGTFIEVTGTIQSSAVGGPGRNYVVDDGSGTIVVRVVDTLGVSTFADGTEIIARGAGGFFSPDFQVNVGLVADIFEDTGGVDTTPPRVSAVSAADENTVRVTFSEPVTAATGNVTGNYSLFPTASPGSPLALNSAVLDGTRRNATLALGSALVDGVGYTVRVANISDDSDNIVLAGATAEGSFTFSTSGVIPIATIQADPASFDGQEVTVEGIVYIPTNYRGTTISGYIQDGSGRGINIFGNGSGVAALQSVGNRVRLTGDVDLFFTTVEILNVSEVILLESGVARPNPVQLSTNDASSADWEGTFIEVSGTVEGSSVGGPGRNYTVDDGSGSIIVRVVDTLGIPIFADGTLVTARGAGGFFNPDYQVNVGVGTDMFEGASGGDITPPLIRRASLETATSVLVQFSEGIDPVTGGNAANYTVFRTAAPAETRTVTGVSLEGATRAHLSLDASIGVGEGWSLTVRNVQDLVGNAISGTGITVPIQQLLAEEVTIDGPPFTFLPREGEVYPISLTIPSNIKDGTDNGDGGHVILRIFDLTGTLRRTLLDTRYVRASDVFDENNEVVVDWDGRDEFRELVPPGAYVAHLRVAGNVNGGTTDVHIPVVVASRLDR